MMCCDAQAASHNVMYSLVGILAVAYGLGTVFVEAVQCHFDDHAYTQLIVYISAGVGCIHICLG